MKERGRLGGARRLRRTRLRRWRGEEGKVKRAGGTPVRLAQDKPAVRNSSFAINTVLGLLGFCFSRGLQLKYFSSWTNKHRELVDWISCGGRGAGGWERDGSHCDRAGAAWGEA